MFHSPAIKRVLTAKQLSRVKISLGLLGVIIAIQGGVLAGSYWYDGETYERMQIK